MQGGLSHPPRVRHVGFVERPNPMSKSSLLIEMIDLLRKRPGITVSELVGALGRSERTIYRWLNELITELHTPVVCVNGGYHLATDAPGKPVNLSPTELLALKLSLRSAPFAAGSPVKRHAESAWLKIREASTETDVRRACGMTAAHAVRVSALEAEVSPITVDTVDEAVLSHHTLRIDYRSQKSNRVKSYTIDPYALTFRRHGWYVVGYCHEHGKVIQLKLLRFLSAVDTGAAFDLPPDFSVDDYFRFSWEAWGGGEPVLVRVRFSPRVAGMIAEARRHHSQLIHAQPDGGVILEVTVAGIEEIGTWIMGYGSDAEVLEPESLRNHIAEHARGTLALYADAGNGSPMLRTTSP